MRHNRLLAGLSPFGGRARELARLDELVANGGLGWVTGPAGSGKSALLAAWIDRLEATNSDRYVCRHFLSRVHGTAAREFVLGNLCRELALRHGLEGELPTSAESLQTLFTSLLGIPPRDGETVIVVLDGLDEALGWNVTTDLFPPLPPRVTVVLSGRDGFLPKELTASVTVAVGPLTRAEVGDVLARFDLPTWSRRGDAIEAIWSASQGDPLYVRLLALDIADGVVDSTAGLAAKPGGLDAYLTAWLEDLAQNVDTDPVEVYDLLGVLCVTKGPIAVEELSLVRDSLRRTGQLRIHVRTGRLRRYVVCDEQDRVSLFHPRARESFSRWLGQRELLAYATDLEAFCAGWHENKARYPLRWYPVHLADEGRQGELRELIGPAWLAAHSARLGHLNSFSAGVELTLAQLPVETVDDVLDVIRLSVIAAVAVDTTGTDVAALFDASGHEDPWDVLSGRGAVAGAQALHRRARVFAERGQPTQAAPFALHALELWAGLSDVQVEYRQSRDFVPATEIAALAGTLDQIGLADDAAAAAGMAVRWADTAVSEVARDSILAGIATSLADTRLLDAAVSAVGYVVDPCSRAQALHPLVDATVAAGRYLDARALADLTTSRWHRLPLLVRLAQALPPGEPLRSEVAADVVAALATDGDDGDWTFGPLLAHALPLAEIHGGDDLVRWTTERAMAAAARQREPMDAVWSLAGVIRECARFPPTRSQAADRLEQLRRNVKALPPDMRRVSGERAIAQALEGFTVAALTDGDVQGALACAREAERLGSQQLGTVPVEHEAVGAKLLQWSDDGPIVGTLEAVAVLNPQAARAEAEALPGREQRQRALGAVLAAAVERRDWREAFANSEMMDDPRVKAGALSLVANALLPVDPEAAADVAREVMRLGIRSSARWRDSWEMADLAAQVAGDIGLPRAVGVAEAIRAPEVRAWAYVLLLRAATAGSDRGALLGLGEHAMKAAVEATAPIDSATLMIGRVTRTGDGNVVFTTRASRGAILPLTRRVLASGLLLENPALGDQGDVVTLVLPEVSLRLAQHGCREQASALVRGLRDKPGVSMGAADADWRGAQVATCLAELGLTEEGAGTAAGVHLPERRLDVWTRIAALAERRGDQAMAGRAWRTATDAAGNIRGDTVTTPTQSTTVARYVVTAARAGRFGEAEAALGGVDRVTNALLQVDGALPAAVGSLGRSGSAAAGVADALLAAAAANAGDDPRRAVDLVAAYADARRFDEARDLQDAALRRLRALAPAGDIVRLLLRLARLTPGADHPPSERIEEVQRVAQAMPAGSDRDDVLAEVMKAVTELGALDQAREVAALIEEMPKRLEALLALVLEYNTAGKTADALDMAGDMAELAEAVDDGRIAARCWSRTALAFGLLHESTAAVVCLMNALTTSRRAGSAEVFRVLGSLLALISSMDPATALSRMNADLVAADDWWAEDAAAWSPPVL